jgi:hypothetical protein
VETEMEFGRNSASKQQAEGDFTQLHSYAFLAKVGMMTDDNNVILLIASYGGMNP